MRLNFSQFDHFKNKNKPQTKFFDHPPFSELWIFLNASRRSGPSETGFRDLLSELFNLVNSANNRFSAKLQPLFFRPYYRETPCPRNF